MTLEERVIMLENRLNALEKPDRYQFLKLLELSDGRNIKVGKTYGTRFGTEATQKLAFYGATPVIRPSAVSLPTITGSATDSAARQAISDIYTNVLKAVGLVP